MKLPMRQLAVLLAAICWAATPVQAQRPSIWISDPIDRNDDDKSMTVYPLELERETRRTSYQALRSADEESIPTLGGELSTTQYSDDANDFGESYTTRPGRMSGRLAPQESPPPRLIGSAALQPMGPEELPPLGDYIYEDDALTMMGPAPLDVTPWGGEPPAAVWSSGEWFRSGIWYTNTDFLVIRRDRPRDQLLIGVDITNPNHLFFNYGATGGIEPAMRVTIGRFIGRDWQNRDHSLEVSFLGINEFKTGQGIRSQQEGGLILLLDQKQGGVNNADVWITEHSSRFHSIEADMRLRHRPDKDRLVMAPDGTWTRQYTSSYVPSMLLGLRYINLNEDFTFFSRSLGEGITEMEFRGDYDIETRNDLLGLQIGGDFINQRESWYCGVRSKAGAFVNFAEQFTVAQFNDLRADMPGDPGDPSIDIAPRVERASRANAAFFGELSLMTGYHFTPNFTARASYDFMWLAGVALAPDQFTFTETARLALDGNIFYQGLSLGLEIVW